MWLHEHRHHAVTSLGSGRQLGGSQVDIICGNCNWQGEMNAGIW
jgi:hypothetical protein